MIKAHMLSNDRTIVKGWWKYATFWHRFIKRQTFYFSYGDGDKFAYWIDRKDNLHPVQFIDLETLEKETK